MSGIKFVLTFFFFIFIFLTLVFFHTHGFIPYDDGWFLQAGLRLFYGEKAYRDFQYLYNPGSLYLNALAFFLFGKSILATRIIALTNSLISVFFLFLIGKNLNWSKPAIFILIFLYVFWGPGHVNFVWPVMFCLTAAIASGGLFLKAENSKRKNFYLFLIGILSAVTFVLKQNFGLAILLTTVLFFFFAKKYRNFKSFIWYFTGYILTAIIQIFYFLYTNTLFIYIREIYFFTVIKIFEQGLLNSSLPWEYPSSFIVKIIKILFYLLPLLISIFAFIKIVRNNKNKILLYFPLITASYYLLSIRPTTDYIHLTPLLALSSVCILIIYHESKSFGVKLLTALIIFLFCIFGFYSALFRNYYRWNPPLISQNVFSNNPRVMIWTYDRENQNINKITSYFEKNAKNEKYILVYNFAPIYYFILDKKNPTPYDFLHGGIMSTAMRKEIIAALKNKKIMHILANTDILTDPTIVGEFIRKNYAPVMNINDYTVWKLK